MLEGSEEMLRKILSSPNCTDGFPHLYNVPKVTWQVKADTGIGTPSVWRQSPTWRDVKAVPRGLMLPLVLSGDLLWAWACQRGGEEAGSGGGSS